jgi:hypothetical protein
MWKRSHKWLWLLVAVLVIPTFSRCNCDDGGPSSSTEVSVNPKSLIFKALQGKEETRTVTVKAESGIITINKVSISRGQAFYKVAGDLKLPIELEEGDTVKISVTYKAPAGAAQSGRLLIETDAQLPQDGKLEVDLLAQINQQYLSFNPNPVQFGELQQGKSKIVTVTGENKGRATLVIEKIELGPNPSKGITFPDGVPKAPITLEPGKSFKFKVEYKPTPQSPDRAVLLFSCKNGCSPGDPIPNRRKDPYELRFEGRLAAPSIDVTPKLLDFGFVKSGDLQTKTFKIINSGSATLKLSSIAFKKGSSGNFIMPALSNVEVKPNASQEVAVQYRPGAAAQDQGTIELKSNDPNRPLFTLPVLGKVSAPDIDVRPKNLNFGKVPLKKTLSITVSNAGNEELTISEISWDGGKPPEFRLVSPPGVPLKLAPNKFTQIQVMYEPKDRAVPDYGKLKIVSNDPDERIQYVVMKGDGSSAKACDLIPVPSSVNFGLGILGKSKVIPVTFTNQGAVPCEISRILVSTDKGGIPPYLGPDVFILPSLPPQCKSGTCNPVLKVPPAGQLSIDVSFLPVQEKQATPFGTPNFTGNLTIVSNSNPANKNVPLTGLATKSCVEVVPDNLDFGLVTVNCSSRNETLTIYNTCKTNLTVTKLGFSSAGANGFRIVQAQLTPFTIPSGQSSSIKMAYRATSPPRKQSAVLEIVHSVTQQSPLSIPMVAKGTTNSNQTDTFKQLKSPQVDILFVIDDSGSMGNDQKNLGNNFSSFIKWAKNLNVDFHIGIVTTDVDGKNPLGGGGNPGKLRGNPKFMTKSTPNLEAVFKRNALVGTGGSASERGLEAARLALSAPLATTGFNKGFLRKDASLSIIVVSDEADQSSQPVQYYINFFRNLKGVRNTSMFRFNAVIGYDPASGKQQCPANGQAQATSKGRYEAVAKASKGILAAICNQNFSATLNKIGAVTFGLKQQFFLSRPADPTSIKVKVNGNPVSQGANTWQYLQTDNSIFFKTAPTAGATVEVSYKAICF